MRILVVGSQRVKGLSKSSQRVCIFCIQTVKEQVQLLLNTFFYVEGCVAAFRNILMLFKDRATEKILTTASEIY